MSTYVIGDVHACYEELQQLLDKISYTPQRDRLLFVGDLINRGPQPLAVLRFLSKLPSLQVVLGNHDLYLLVLGYGLMREDAYDHRLEEVLAASDKFELLDWLRHQPLIYRESACQALIVHAGIPPQWTIDQSLACGEEVHHALVGPDFQAYLSDLFGNEPASWSSQLSGQQRLRYITNALTRMRFCQQDGTLEFSAQHAELAPAPGFKPWFQWRSQEPTEIFFGHWAVLNGQCEVNHCYALDTGCVWGRALTAIRLEDKQRVSIEAAQNT